MKIGDKVKTKYLGANTEYGIIIEQSNREGCWKIHFIEGYISARGKAYVYKITRMEELLYF